MLFLGGCYPKQPKNLRINQVETPSPTPDDSLKEPVFFKGTELKAQEGDRKYWSLKAEKATYDEERKTAGAQLIECTFYNARNEAVLFVFASGANVSLDSDSVDFQGDVQVKAASGEELIVKKLRWDGKKKKLEGEGGVKIVRKYSVMTARRMIADPELKNVELYEDVRVNYKDADNIFSF